MISETDLADFKQCTLTSDLTLIADFIKEFVVEKLLLELSGIMNFGSGYPYVLYAS